MTNRKLPRFDSNRLNCASVTQFPGVVVRYGIGSSQKKYPTTVTSRRWHVTSQRHETFLYTSAHSHCHVTKNVRSRLGYTQAYYNVLIFRPHSSIKRRCRLFLQTE